MLVCSAPCLGLIILHTVWSLCPPGLFLPCGVPPWGHDFWSWQQARRQPHPWPLAVPRGLLVELGLGLLSAWAVGSKKIVFSFIVRDTFLPVVARLQTTANCEQISKQIHLQLLPEAPPCILVFHRWCSWNRGAVGSAGLGLSSCTHCWWFTPWRESVRTLGDGAWETFYQKKYSRSNQIFYYIP